MSNNHDLFDISAEPIMGFNGDFRFLSNFYPCQIIYQGIEYKSVETAYVAAKTPDCDIKYLISNMKPGEAKRFGRESIKLSKNWDIDKVIHMRNLTILKYTDKNLANLLINTYPRKIVEANTWGDKFWGTDVNGKGKNTLGMILMEHRLTLLRNKNGLFVLE